MVFQIISGSSSVQVIERTLKGLDIWTFLYLFYHLRMFMQFFVINHYTIDEFSNQIFMRIFKDYAFSPTF